MYINAAMGRFDHRYENIVSHRRDIEMENENRSVYAPFRAATTTSELHQSDHEQHGSQHFTQIRPWRNMLSFTLGNRLMLIALGVGTSGALGCFGFTYWLSRQRFNCPSWTFHCEVRDDVQYIVKHLGLIQGILSSLFQAFIAMVVYASYQYAETVIWPVLAEQSYTLKGIDHFLLYARGSLPEFSSVVWQTRRWNHFAIVLLIGLVGIIVQASSAILGWSFTIVPINTTYHSNHTTGGGMGFGYTQTNPPSPIPIEAQYANTIYSGWSNNQATEMLPELRDFLIDRTNVSLVGNFSAHAIEARKNINCYGTALQLGKYEFDSNVYTVANETGDEFSSDDSVLLRFEPGQLTVWVDKYWSLSSTRSVSKLVFAILNGTIENGQNTEVSAGMEEACLTLQNNAGECHNISALACEVDVDLVDSLACVGECTETSSTMSSLDTLTSCPADPDSSYPCIATWLGSIPALMGPSIYGAQPMFRQGQFLDNSSHALPLAYSDSLDQSDLAPNWSQANLTNFINVASGALGIYIAQAWTKNSTILESQLEMPRLDTGRSFVLLVPLGVTLLVAVILAALSALLHRSAQVANVRLGGTTEILLSSETDELRNIITQERMGKTSTNLEKIKFQYGLDEEGYDVLSPDSHVKPFRGR